MAPLCPIIRGGALARWLVLALYIGAGAAPGLAAPREAPRLAGLYDDWLEAVSPIASAAERELFGTLPTDIERERFIEAFWSRRSPAQRRRFTDNREAAEELLLRSREQLQVVALAGKPSSRERFVECDNLLRRTEIWHYPGPGGDAPPIGLVFVQTRDFDPRSARLWSPTDPGAAGFGARPDALERAIDGAERGGCVSAPETRRLRRQFADAPGFDRLAELHGWTVAAGAPIVDEGGHRFGEARLELDTPGRVSRFQLLRGTVRVPVNALAALGGVQLFDRVVIVGDLYRGGRFVDSFRVTHLVAGAPPRSGLVDLDVYRRVTAGDHLLKIRVTGEDGRVLLREDRSVDVPLLRTEAPPPPGRRRGFALATRDEVLELTTLPQVELLPLSGPSPSDHIEIEAVTTGGPIAEVRLERDGALVGSSAEPPYRFRIELTAASHRLRALALDGGGLVLDADEQVVRRGATPLSVALGPAEPGEGDDVWLPVRLTVPEHDQLESVVCFVNDQRTQPLAGGCPAPPPPYPRLAFVRVVARLTSGETAEDVRFLSTVATASVEVRLAELFVSVLDDLGRPLSDVAEGRFHVLQGGTERTIASVTTVDRLPLSVAVLLDTSSSMGRRVQLAAKSAQAFFESVVGDGDQASLLSFGDDVRQRVPFTGDVGRLRYGALGARAHGTTRLWDGMVYTAASFASLPGRRAMVVLTDGADTDSDHQPPQVLAAVRRAHVMVFAIALGDVGGTTAADLEGISRETGGRLFRAPSIDHLDSAYRTIERILRGQYRVLFHPAPEVLGRSPVDVRVEGSGGVLVHRGEPR